MSLDTQQTSGTVSGRAEKKVWENFFVRGCLKVLEVVCGWESMRVWTSTICTVVRGVCDIAGEHAMEGFAEDLVEGLVEDAEEVTLSKTENLLQTVSEGATFSQEKEKTVDG